MPDQQITNASSAFGQTAFVGVRAIPMVNISTSTVEAFSVVALSTVSAASPGNTGFVTPSTAAVTNIVGVLQTDAAVGASGMVVVEGPSLIAVTSNAIPAVGDLLAASTVVAQSTATGTPLTALVKTTTAATPIGSVIGYCLSTALSAYVSTSTSIGVFVPAYIHKM